jgi:hypothetical protein
LGLSKSLNLESKNVLRCKPLPTNPKHTKRQTKAEKPWPGTAVGIERMPKVRVTESGEVGEPPDSQIRYLPITMTGESHTPTVCTHSHGLNHKT